ncbi:MAG: flavin reductase family protein [Desulfobacteraceae bacterium]|jgi:flavin reductase (DIM6/NTAB) family NADH-FMN oxidoreductase RutF|nr:flavin reductase family protein [Desulfobacteraceae bacterium]
MDKAPEVFYWLPCAVVFVSTAHEDQRDIMTATAMFVSEKEPLLMISVAKDHLTEQLINQSGKFTLVIAGDDQGKLAMKIGVTKGDATDKFEKFSIPTLSETSGSAPVPEGAAAWMVCEVESSQDIKGYRLFIGRVVDQYDSGNPPLIWQKDKFFGLKPL